MRSHIKNKLHSDVVKRITKFRYIYDYYRERRITVGRNLYVAINNNNKIEIIQYAAELKNVKHQIKHFQSLILQNKMIAKNLNRKYQRKTNKN